MLWIKQFRSKKLQSVMIFMIIGLCALLMSGSLIILTSLKKPYQDLYAETKAADVRIHPNSVTVESEEWIDKLLDIDGVSAVEEVTKYPVDALFVGGEREDAFIDIVEYNPEVYKNTRMLNGSLENLENQTCAIPSVIANLYDLEVGDEFSIKIEDTMVTYEVGAIFADVYSISNAFTMDIIVKTLPEQVPYVAKGYLVWLENEYTNLVFLKDYTMGNDGILDGYFRTADDCITNAAITENILGGVLLGISSSVFLLILAILGYIIKNSIQEDQMNIAIYKAIGYNQKTIEKIYRYFYQMIILGGSIVGVLFANILSYSFMKNVYENLAIEVRMLRNVKPIDILMKTEESLGVKKQKTSKQRKEITNFSTLAMVSRLFTREKRNTFLILFTCFLSVYIVNVGVVCLDNIRLMQGETNYYWLGIDKHDITIENLASKEKFYDICEELKTNPDVAKSVRRNYESMAFSIPYYQTVSGMIYESFEEENFVTIKGRNPIHTDEITLGNICLKELNLEVGDYITMNFDGEHSRRMLIVGSFQGFYNMGRGARVLGKTLEESGVAYTYDGCSLILKDGVDQEEAVNQLKNEYGEHVKVIERKDLFKNIMEMINKPQKAAITPMIYITGMIGSITIFYIIFAFNRKKKKTFAIYKAIGYPASKLIMMNCIYIGVIAVVSVFLGILATIFIFPQIMVLAMSGFGFEEYKLSLETQSLVITNISMIGLFMIATLLSSRNLKKNHLSEIVNE